MEGDNPLENTADAGEKAVNRTDELLNRIAETMSGMAGHLGALTEHVTKLEARQAVEEIPATARDGINDGLDVAGAGGSTVVKAVDVPLAVAQDTVHDTGEVVADTDQTVKKANKKLFKRKSRR